MSKKFAIIVAGGSGSRMQTELPKQFLLIHNKPILMHSIEKFAMDDIEIILVLNVDYHEYWEKLCTQYSFTIPHILVQGGRNRFESVKNGLKHVSSHSIVAVHDAVRPLIKQERIKEAFAYAETHGNAVISVRSKDSIRRVQEEHSTSVPRDEYYLIQTPQVFQSELLIKAYKEEFRNEFTDDASVVERLGIRINLIEGDYSNLKITFPEDLLFAESLLK
jgi:2-C-methyl-D-erythritol 4-phosphate cytidylyltransferase